MSLYRKKIIFFICYSFFILSITTINAEELLPGVRIGYDFFNSGIMGYYEEETGRTAQTDNRESAPYITFIAFPNQISGGLYWNVKYGYRSFEKNKQKFDLAEDASRGGNNSFLKEGDLGTRNSAEIYYFIPSLYYHFFRESAVSLMIGLGYGLGYAKIKGDLYITDSYAKSNLDEDCHDYLLNNKSHENISQFCERVKLEKEGAQVAWSPHFTIQGENIGFEFTWINMNLDDDNRKAKWDISYSNLALYYQFNFE